MGEYMKEMEKEKREERRGELGWWAEDCGAS